MDQLVSGGLLYKSTVVPTKLNLEYTDLSVAAAKLTPSDVHLLWPEVLIISPSYLRRHFPCCQGQE